MINAESVLARYHASVPRYTSYPTAPKFEIGKGKELLESMLSGLQKNDPVSVYIHIPFCDRLCWFCGCNTKHTLRYQPVTQYIDHVLQEIALLKNRGVSAQPISHLHLGGGSPSLLRLDDMVRLRQALETIFTFSPATEISVEIDPSDANAEMFDALNALGITRASIGVQDFHPDVQKAINRPQSLEDTASVVTQLRAMNIKSINMDALYGLPLQSQNRLLDTLDKCASLQPDRMALFGYAHVPWMKKHQQMIKNEDLPGPLERHTCASNAADFLVTAGYDAIGIDHFAKPEDAMAKAAKAGTLHRNFQGYTTDTSKTMIGLGGSSIGYFDGGYIQNFVATGQYQDAVKHGKFAADKGYQLTEDDKMRGYFIERLMCDLRVNLNDVRRKFERHYPAILAEIIAAKRDDTLGLCTLENDVVSITEEARPFTRIVASWFDAHFEAGKQKFSQAV